MNLWNTLKNLISDPVPEPVAEPAPAAPAKYSRSEHEKTQISAFREEYGTLLEKLEDAIYDTNRRMKKEEDRFEKVELCRKVIASYEKLRTVCTNAGNGGTLYFEDMWEHCSNSSNPDFAFIDPVKETMYQLME